MTGSVDVSKKLDFERKNMNDFFVFTLEDLPTNSVRHTFHSCTTVSANVPDCISQAMVLVVLAIFFSRTFLFECHAEPTKETVSANCLQSSNCCFKSNISVLLTCMFSLAKGKHSK